jgi:hypothetical protein
MKNIHISPTGEPTTLFKLIHTQGYLLVVDDSEIKEGEMYFMESDIDDIRECGSYDGIPLFEEGGKKIIAHLPLNESPILEGVDLLPPLEDEVEQLAQSAFTHPDFGKYKIGSTAYYNGYKDGYNKAKEKYKYTEEDMRTAISETRKGMLFSKTYEDEYIQSLNLPKMPVVFECEIQYFYMSSEYYYGTEAGWVKCDESQYESIRKEIPTCPLKKVHKETTTPEGHTQWVGKYIY